MAFDALLVGTRASGNGAPITTGAGTTVAGDKLVILIHGQASASAATVSDNKGNTYTPAAAAQVNGNTFSRIFYCENPVVGTGHTATVSFGSNDFFGTIYLIRITEAATSSFDQVQGANDSASPYQVTLPDLSQADEIVLFIGGDNSGGTLTYTSPDSTMIDHEPDGGNFWTSGVAKRVVASTTGPTMTMANAVTSGDWAFMAASFKKAPAGGGSCEIAWLQAA